MTKYHKTDIYLACEGRIDRTFSSSYNPQAYKEFFVAKKWVRRSGFIVSPSSELQIQGELGYLNEINKVIAVTTHIGTANIKLSQYVKKHGFNKPFDYFIMIDKLTLDSDTTLVSVRRNYKAHKTILFDFVHHTIFNAKRFLPRAKNNDNVSLDKVKKIIINGQVWQNTP